MSDATVTSKGQVTIPADIRRRLNLQASDRITFTPMPDGTVLLRAKTGALEQVGGMLRGKRRKPVPLAQLGLTAADQT